MLIFVYCSVRWHKPVWNTRRSKCNWLTFQHNGTLITVSHRKNWRTKSQNFHNQCNNIAIEHKNRFQYPLTSNHNSITFISYPFGDSIPCVVPITTNSTVQQWYNSDKWYLTSNKFNFTCSIVVSRVQCRMKLRYLAIWGVLRM